MKKLTVRKDVDCKACLACVRACSEAFYKEFHPDKSCITIIERNGAVRPMTCVQCGKCAKNCPEEAITQNKFGVYTINKKKCVNCGKCAEVCPFGLIVYKPNGTAPNKCIVCGACVKACPAEILYVMEKE